MRESDEQLPVDAEALTDWRGAGKPDLHRREYRRGQTRRGSGDMRSIVSLEAILGALEALFDWILSVPSREGHAPSQSCQVLI